MIDHDDHSAFEYLFDAYYEKLMRVAIYYLGNEMQAEDVLAEVFFKIWNNRRKLNKVENLDNYIFTMTKNQCLYFLRSNKKIVFDDQLVDDKHQIIIENPESSFISEEFITYYNKKVSELPPKCKLVYLMIKEDGLKYREVADLLNISMKTVENQMTKAIAHVRKSIALYNSYHSDKSQTDNQ